MTHFVTRSFVALLMTTSLIGSADAMDPLEQFASTISSLTSAAQPAAEQVRSENRPVQTTPAYRFSRPEVVSGARMTLFANFLQHQQGVVYLDIAGTTASCRICDWRSNSVTFYLPQLGVPGPVDARLRVVLPNGRVAKAVNVSLIPQPVFVIHSETIGQPAPSGMGGAANYAGSW